MYVCLSVVCVVVCVMGSMCVCGLCCIGCNNFDVCVWYVLIACDVLMCVM